MDDGFRLQLPELLGVVEVAVRSRPSADVRHFRQGKPQARSRRRSSPEARRQWCYAPCLGLQCLAGEKPALARDNFIALAVSAAREGAA
jgi:hypothetical protein